MVPRITAADLAGKLLGPYRDKIAIVDVRDDDHIGGHIHSSIHMPSQSINSFMPDLVRNLRDKEVVVFHCALSQQRGPAAAGGYLRERERVRLAREFIGGKKAEEVEEKMEEGKENRGKEQKVYVLDRGFVGWQEVYGEDEKLTEGYNREIWKDGYWM